MKTKNKLLLISTFLLFISCLPDKLDIVEQEEFRIINMDPVEYPVAVVNPKTGGAKTFVIYATHHTDSIVRFEASEHSLDFEIDTVFCNLIDPTKPVSIDENGYLSRKLSSVVFNYTVKIPNSFREGIYSVKFTITTGKGETKNVIAKFRAVDFLQYPSVLTVYNGRAKTNLKEYLSTATCFIRFITNTSIITDDTVDPPVKDTIPYSITGYATNTATAITTTNRPNVYAHIYTDLSNFEKRTMYLVSPNTEWIADSLRILNNFSATYPAAEMNDVKYVDLGAIDFINIESSNFDNIPFETKGESMVKLIEGHSYAFNVRDGRVGIIYVKKIQYYTPNYTTASPTAYILIAVQAEAQ